MRTWIIPLAVLMVVPALGAAAPIVVPPVPEQLVEGHTVFTVIEQVNVTATNHTEFAAAVAVLVRQATAIQVNDRFPGVLWFNDQYLVDPIKNDIVNTVVRYPCTGAVLATNAGDPDPRPAFPIGGPTLATYIESYLITDPNDQSWDVDQWTWTTPGGGITELIWTVAVLNNQAGYSTPDDGVSSCNPISDQVLYNSSDSRCGPNSLPPPVGPLPPPADKVGTPARSDLPSLSLSTDTYMNGDCTHANHQAAKYNALLFFFLEDLTVAGADKDHTTGSADYLADGSGCQVETTPNAQYFTDHWPCPGGGGVYTAGNDNAEGNSHPYNPFSNNLVCPHCTGSGNHGGSGASGLQFSHATRNIDVYYWIGSLPLIRSMRVTDTEGSLAPFHCHTGQILDTFTGEAPCQ